MSRNDGDVNGRPRLNVRIMFGPRAEITLILQAKIPGSAVERDHARCIQGISCDSVCSGERGGSQHCFFQEGRIRSIHLSRHIVSLIKSGHCHCTHTSLKLIAMLHLHKPNCKQPNNVPRVKISLAGRISSHDPCRNRMHRGPSR